MHDTDKFLLSKLYLLGIFVKLVVPKTNEIGDNSIKFFRETHLQFHLEFKDLGMVLNADAVIASFHALSRTSFDKADAVQALIKHNVNDFLNNQIAVLLGFIDDKLERKTTLWFRHLSVLFYLDKFVLLFFVF